MAHIEAIEGVEVAFREERLRTPLKFRDGVVETVSGAWVRLRVRTDSGKVGIGQGHVLLSDLWAWPSPLPHTFRDQALRDFTLRIAQRLEGLSPQAHPLTLGLDIKPDLERWRWEASASLPEALPSLAALMCWAPFDAALHDAFGKALGISSYAALGPDFADSDLSRWLGEGFRGRYASDFLRPHPAPRLPIFHLVGGLDPLREEEVPEDAPSDGLPNSLEAWIRREGVFCFKVKLSGTDGAADVARTQAVAEVAAEALEGREFFLSVDSNEQHAGPEAVLEYLERLEREAPLAYQRLLYLEQPTERDLRAHAFDMRPVAARKPVLADEGVIDLESLRLALELGWSGVALKVCKGHSFALLTVAFLEAQGGLYSVQDLTSVGLALVQQAGLAAHLRRPLQGFEYNARQYLPFAALEVQRALPSLFQVRDGQVVTKDLTGPGLGSPHALPSSGSL